MPITGGTMLVTRQGDQVVIADPDRDRILTVDLATDAIVSEIALTAGDEPGRVIEDGAGRIHVALRRGGSIVTLASATAGEIAARRYACSEPRGLAWDAATDALHVACSTGELVTFPAAGGDAVRTLRLERDLRDVIVSGDKLVVTRFRSAEVITLDAQGAIVNREVPPPVLRFGGTIPFLDKPDASIPPEPGQAPAAVAWRTIALADGRLVMSHQRQRTPLLDAEQEGGYGGNCGSGPIESGVTVFDPRNPTLPPQVIRTIARGALPVDIAISTATDRVAVVLAGQRTVTVDSLSTALSRGDEDDCRPDDEDDDDNDDDQGEDLGAPTSAAFTSTGQLVIYYPERSALVVRAVSAPVKRTIALTGERANDAGRVVFHKQTSLQLACASCHPEGREDGLVWTFAQFGHRRTQSLAGHLLERAPFHWSGDMQTLDVLMDDVFAVRMSGGEATPHQKRALGVWLNQIPPPAPMVVDALAAARGKQIFESDEAACLSCHNGDLMSNNQLVTVGTGGAFKVPSLLGVSARAPFMHDGCAETLTARFVSCGGGNAHGRTEHLTAAQIADLVAYLESI